MTNHKPDPAELIPASMAAPRHALSVKRKRPIAHLGRSPLNSSAADMRSEISRLRDALTDAQAETEAARDRADALAAIVAEACDYWDNHLAGRAAPILSDETPAWYDGGRFLVGDLALEKS